MYYKYNGIFCICMDIYYCVGYPNNFVVRQARKVSNAFSTRELCNVEEFFSVNVVVHEITQLSK